MQPSLLFNDLFNSTLPYPIHHKLSCDENANIYGKSSKLSNMVRENENVINYNHWKIINVIHFLFTSYKKTGSLHHAHSYHVFG